MLITTDKMKLDKAQEAFALDVLLGLSDAPKRIPSRYMYDERGSELFRQIMRLEEYYPTRLEHAVLSRYASNIADAIGDVTFNLVELGAGDGWKTKVLLRVFTERNMNFTYCPVDISASAMHNLIENLKQEFPSINHKGIVAEYVDGIKYLSEQTHARNIVLFLGSNIGNFDKIQARGFLRKLWYAFQPDDLLLTGFDLKKEIDVLLRAYNDSKGVTRAFNLNLLERINRELEADFDLEKFGHYGTYNAVRGAMESYLISWEPQDVTIGAIGKRFHFDAWEPIHVEYSYKYLLSDIDSLAVETGYTVIDHFTDEKEFFVDSLWRVDKV